MVHKMHLRKGPFRKIWSGEKYIELRMLDEKRKQISVGDMIEFAYEDNPRITMIVKVVALHKAANFKELFEVLPLKRCGFEEDDICGACLQMEEYPGYDSENQQRLGVLGIEFEEMPYKKPYRDPFRMEKFLTDFQDKLLKYWSCHPDYRFGQILTVFQYHLKNRGVEDFFYLEDDDFVKLLSQFIDKEGVE